MPETHPHPTHQERRAARRDDTVCVHIFTVSATLVGVCLTVIGIFRVLTPLHGADTAADEILVFDALLFLAANGSAYIGLRTRRVALRRRIERVADLTFLTALVLMTAVCALIVYELV